MAEYQLRSAVIGTGFVGRLHARAIRLAGARLVGVAASNPASASAAARELGAERWAEAEQLVMADDVDVVHLCTPNALHEPMALAALAAGKHVVCEKPVALDGDGAARIADAARSAGRLVAVPFVYRFHPTVRQARSLVRNGTTGPLRLIHGSYQQDWLSRPDDDSWRVDASTGGRSRAFADIGSHWCDLVEFVSGQRVAKLLAHLAVAVPERPSSHRRAFAREADHDAASANGAASLRPVTTEDIALVIFETNEGVSGSVVVSQVSPGRKNRLWFELDGADASIVFDQEQAEQLSVGRVSGTTTLLRDPTQLEPEAARLAILPAGHAQGYQDCFDLFVADVYAAIGGAQPDGLPLVAAGVRAARITDAVLASAESRTWIDVAERGMG